MAQVRLEQVRKVYPNGFVAVHGFNLDIADREFVVFVGPSGCGKSTTLRMVAGLEEISDGTITIGDRVVNDIDPKDRDIAMVFQNYALYPHMTVRKNMAFGLKLRGESPERIAEKVDHAAAILGIEPLLDRKPRELSGGQRQRVAVGRAIVRDPACFLFDEPLSNLDAKLRVEMRAEIKRLHLQLQTTTVYVTHDQEEAMTLGDRIVVLKAGHIMQVGTPLEIYRHPANRFVAGFLGTPPMNFVEGTIAATGGEVWFESADRWRVKLSQRTAGILSEKSGQPVVMGLRPETLSLTPIPGQSANEIVLPVRVTELLGDRMDVYFDTPDQQRFVARVDATADLTPGSHTTLHINMDRVHFFEPDDPDAAPHESGRNLCIEPGSSAPAPEPIDAAV